MGVVNSPRVSGRGLTAYAYGNQLFVAQCAGGSKAPVLRTVGLPTCRTVVARTGQI